LKKPIIFLILTILIFSGCELISAPDLEQENIETFEVQKATSAPSDSPDSKEETGNSQETTAQENISLENKFAKIEFFMVAGFYSRKAIQEDIEYTEMFSLDKNNFIRVAENDFEQEVYAYNYISDDFTYLYYFDGELISKTVFNIDTGAILQDEEGFTELLKIDAEELKIYFGELIKSAELSIDDL
jgi:hypothetical protein